MRGERAPPPLHPPPRPGCPPFPPPYALPAARMPSPFARMPGGHKGRCPPPPVRGQAPPPGLHVSPLHLGAPPPPPALLHACGKRRKDRGARKGRAAQGVSRARRPMRQGRTDRK